MEVPVREPAIFLQRLVRQYCSQGMIPHAYLSLLGTVSEPFAIHSKKAILLTLISLPLRNAGYTDVERGERGSTEEHLTVTQFKVQREQERLDALTAQADEQAQSLAKTCQTLSKKEKELAAVQKKTTLTKEALIHVRDLDYIGKHTFLGNYSLTEEEFSMLKKQADHGYMMDVENRRLKEELTTAKKEAAHWGQKYHELWYEVKPYLDALHRAPELVRSFLEKILAPKQERTMNVPQRNRKRGQDMEL